VWLSRSLEHDVLLKAQTSESHEGYGERGRTALTQAAALSKSWLKEAHRRRCGTSMDNMRRHSKASRSIQGHTNTMLTRTANHTQSTIDQKAGSERSR